MARTALLVGRSALCCDCRSVLRIVLGQPTGQGHSVVEQGARSLHELMGAVLPVKGGADSETPVQPDQFGQMIARFLGGSHSKGVHPLPAERDGRRRNAGGHRTTRVGRANCEVADQIGACAGRQEGVSQHHRMKSSDLSRRELMDGRVTAPEGEQRLVRRRTSEMWDRVIRPLAGRAYGKHWYAVVREAAVAKRRAQLM